MVTILTVVTILTFSKERTVTRGAVGWWSVNEPGGLTGGRRRSSPVVLAYAAAVLLGIMLNVPYWRALGLLG
jgi:hypothetical protein